MAFVLVSNTLIDLMTTLLDGHLLSTIIHHVIYFHTLSEFKY